VWFALNDDRPLFAFAGIWIEFKGDRGTKSKPIPGPHFVYGFLTTEPNSFAIIPTNQSLIAGSPFKKSALSVNAAASKIIACCDGSAFPLGQEAS